MSRVPDPSRALQADLRQTRPFRTPYEELFVSLQRTAALLEHALEAALKPSGITATQYNVLRILRGAGPAGLCRADIGERMIRRVPDVTRLLDRMEDAGLIDRQRNGADRRFVTTRITEVGLRATSLADDAVSRFLDTHLGHLEPESVSQLLTLLADARAVPAR